MLPTEDCTKFGLPMPKRLVKARRSSLAIHKPSGWKGSQLSKRLSPKGKILVFLIFFVQCSAVPGSTRRRLEGRASEYGSDEEGDGKDPDMTVGSPGAGSLPIEIKWPGRRDR